MKLGAYRLETSLLIKYSPSQDRKTVLHDSKGGGLKSSGSAKAGNHTASHAQKICQIDAQFKLADGYSAGKCCGMAGLSAVLTFEKLDKSIKSARCKNTKETVRVLSRGGNGKVTARV